MTKKTLLKLSIGLAGIAVASAHAANVTEVKVIPEKSPISNPVMVMTTVYGVGCESITLEFGDGTNAMVPVPDNSSPSTGIQIKTDHVFAQPGFYKPTAKAGAGSDCSGSAITLYGVNVLPTSDANKIAPSMVLGSPGPNGIGTNTGSNIAVVKISGVLPGGSCARAFVSWGDGSSPEPLSGAFPLQGQHHYQQGGMWTVNVNAAPGFACEGEASGKFYAFPKPGKLSGPLALPSAQPGQNVPLMISGLGVCDDVRIDQGNYTTKVIGKVIFSPAGQFKWPASLQYTKAGDFGVIVRDFGPSNCGSVAASIHVAEPPSIHSMKSITPPSALVQTPGLQAIPRPGAPTGAVKSGAPSR